MELKIYHKKIRKIAFAFLFALTMFLGGAEIVRAATLLLNPGSGNFMVGSTFDLSIILNTKGVPVNVIEIELFFSSDKLQLTSPLIGKSIIQLWPTPPVFSNQEGRIYFAGAIPSPGINTSEGVVLTLTFRVVSLGEGEIRFGSKTDVLANDGIGTNILNQKPSAFFSFSFPPPLGPAISSPTHPDQEKWYRDPNPVFLWSKSQFADAYSWTIDNNPSGFSGTEVKSTDSVASFQNLENGIWYFHLRERAEGVWGGVSHHLVKIDNTPPASFKVNVSPSLRTTNKNPIFRFFTADVLSGFDYFGMKIIPLSAEFATEALFFEVSPPHQVLNLKTGRYQVILRALDKAGNTRDEMVTMNIIGSFTQFISPEGFDLVFVFLTWPKVVAITAAILILVIIILIILWIRHRHHIKHAFKEDIGNLFNFLRKNKEKNKV